MGIERVGLEHHRHAAVRGLDPRHIAITDVDLAVGGFLKPRDHPQKGGLAAARRADKHTEFAVLDVQIHTVDHLNVTVFLNSLRQRHARHGGPPPKSLGRELPAFGSPGDILRCTQKRGAMLL